VVLVVVVVLVVLVLVLTQPLQDRADVSDRDAVEAMVERTVAEFGRLDIAVANAYHSVRQPLLEQEWPVVEKTLSTTLNGAYHTLQLAAKAMVDTAGVRGGGAHGKLIAIGSVNGPYPYLLPGSTAYNVSKAGVEALVQNFASALSGHRINVNCVRPGWILTEGETGGLAGQPADATGIVEMAAQALPFGIGAPEDVAEAVGFLCSDKADYITGVTLPVDGGFGISQRVPGMHDPIAVARAAE